MKKKNIVIIATLVIIIISSFKVATRTNTDEKKFIGSWTGSEKDNQIKGLTKYWVQTRYKDGTFIIMFTNVQDCEVEHLVEKGKWYIKDGLFNETHNSSGKTDIYTYEILDDSRIKFKAKQLAVEVENEAYEFVDTKLEAENE